MKTAESKNEKIIRKLALLICSCGIFMCVILAYTKYVKGDNILPHTEISIILSVTIVAIMVILRLIDWKEFGRSIKKVPGINPKIKKGNG